MAVNDNDRNDQTLQVTHLEKKNVESIVSSIGIILKMFDLVSILEMSLHLNSQIQSMSQTFNFIVKEMCNLRRVEYILLSGKLIKLLHTQVSV